MGDKTVVSVIICTKNRAEDLRQTLHAIGKLSVPDGLAVELMVVDNGSSDHTASVVEGYVNPASTPIRYIYEPRAGLSVARNTALSAAKGDILLFTDDDIRPPTEWISLMCEPILSGKAHAVAGNVVIAPHLERPWMLPEHRAYLACHEGSYEEPGNMTGANMGFSREVLTQVPEFDTELGAGKLGCCEEVLFSWQLKRAGYKIVSVPKAFVEHHFHEDRLHNKSFFASAKLVGRSQAYLHHHWEHKEQKHLQLLLLRKTIQVALLNQTNRIKKATKIGADPRELKAVSHLHLLRQSLLEQKRPRNYKRYGLTKQSGLV